jgi:signal transduction histidine kinase
MDEKQAPQRRNPRGLRHLAGSTWFAPAVLAVLFVGVLALLLWLIQARALQADRHNLADCIGTTQESIRQRLHAMRDHLATLAEDMGRDTITQDLFTKRLAHHMSEHPELVSAMYVDADGTARWAVPPQWEEKVLGRPLACKRSLECCREAEQTRGPVYTDVHISLQNEPAFDLSIPIYSQDKFFGSIVAVHSCEQMLRNMISPEIIQKYRVSLVDGQGNTVFALPAVSRIDERLSVTAPLDPPGHGLFVRLDHYGSGFWGVGMTLLVVLCVGLAFGMAWGMWSLKRQIARRITVEQLLLEARDGLAERVRERTADLEAANQRLQSEMAERRRAEQESRRHQEELAHVARLSTMGEMATGLAHELNQPLGAIASFAEGILRLMESDRAAPEAVRAALTEVSAQARRAGLIIQRLRSFVATGDLKSERHRLRPLAEELADLVASDVRNEQIDFHLDVPESLPAVLVNGIQAQQVLLNLIRNSIEALRQVAPDRRRIDVTAMPGHNGSVTVSVSDTGPGCPPESLAKMFEAFFTTKKSGIGMGLSISRSIVEAHGGRIWAENRPSGGLTVYFTIPTVDGAHDVADCRV